MYAKKTLRLMVSNYGTHVKSLIVQILAICLIAAIFGLFFANLGGLLTEVIEDNGLITQLREIINDLTHWDEVIEDDFSAKVINFIDSVKLAISTIPDIGSRLLTAVWIFLIASYIMYLVLNFSVYPTFFCINSFMTTNTRPYFLWTVTKKFVDSIRMMSIRALMCLTWDLCILFLVLGAYLLVFFGQGIFGLIMTLVVWAALESLRNTILAYWLPININETPKVMLAFKKGITLMMDSFWMLFLKTFIVTTIICLLTMAIVFVFVPIVVVIFTVMLIFASNYILNCIYFVSYFEAKDKAYFVKKVSLMQNYD